MRSRECYFGVYLNKPQTVRHESIYIILLLTRLQESRNNDNNDDLLTSTPCFTHSVYVLLMTSQSIADDVTNALCITRSNSCDTRTRKAMSNTFDINLIHDHIHGRSCTTRCFQFQLTGRSICDHVLFFTGCIVTGFIIVSIIACFPSGKDITYWKKDTMWPE